MSSPVLLCIDDRPEILKIRKSNLEPLGYSVLTATNAITAIAILEHVDIAAVLMQYKAEGMDVEAVAYHIKQRFPDKPILLLSAHVHIPERVLWLVDDYIANSEYPQRLPMALQQMAALPAPMTPGRDPRRKMRPSEAA